VQENRQKEEKGEKEKVSGRCTGPQRSDEDHAGGELSGSNCMGGENLSKKASIFKKEEMGKKDSGQSHHGNLWISLKGCSLKGLEVV